MIYFFILIIILFILIKTIKPNKCLQTVKEKYNTFLDYVNSNDVPDKYKVLRKRILISGFTNTTDSLGYNVNKGDEIAVCVDGTPNQAFHVLIHELAHSTVEEYSHSENFWKNFDELKQMCTKIGIYNPIDNKSQFCGKYITD
jgi:hypothetical protein